MKPLLSHSPNVPSHTLMKDAVEDILADAQNYLFRRAFGVAISAPALMAMDVGTAPEIRSRREKRKGAGVLGSPAGHPPSFPTLSIPRLKMARVKHRDI